MAVVINVFTLNCWGIPFISKNRKDRMDAISKYLSQGIHEIVCLQEVWDEKDYIFISQQVRSVLPYSHYFYSGVCGSGICVLSKWPIIEVFFHAWPLNGYVHMIHHGDWFGGKGVGLCRIQADDIIINVYSAHLHAEYNTEDIYLAHRTLQAFNTAEFIKLTSSCADLCILAGDLNTQPNDLAYRMIREVAMLNDSCDLDSLLKSGTDVNEAEITSVCSLGTNERRGNTYSNLIDSTRQPEGKRIDYILYHPGTNYNVEVKNYSLPLRETVPGKQFSYSDHDAVSATLSICKTSKVHPCKVLPSFNQTLANGISVCEEALMTLKFSGKKYLFYTVSLFLLLLSTVGLSERTYIDIPRLIIAAALFYFLFMGTLWNYMEWNGVLSGKKGMQILFERLSSCPVNKSDHSDNNLSDNN